ncbi:hypothetical protein [Herbaspirillum rubrisubalbicans]|jgi:hypothetical protein|uniref:hypothetical protein n=1 Tax=Herbaspirillum rubrisubalbicans TaxID=80842 RepID=UPI000308A15D|nr:hypothetical protein [Herbaspirillum rubrisubalbicans]MCP1575037.1 hypothetical protein [Herbaspirillum rubrisubalbicans]
MFLYLPFLLAFLTVLGISFGWKSLSNKLWLATMGLTLWRFSPYLQLPPGLVL